jgi:hypothetical protein
MSRAGERHGSIPRFEYQFAANASTPVGAYLRQGREGSETAEEAPVPLSGGRASGPSMGDGPPAFLCRGCGTPKQPKGKLVQRNGKFGKFFGCSRYPVCKHTEQVSYKGPAWVKGAGSGRPAGSCTSPPLAGTPGFLRSPGAVGASAQPDQKADSSTGSPPQETGARSAGVHGFGSGFGPAPTKAKSCSRTPFQGGEAFRSAHRAPSPQPVEKKKRRIVGGRVVTEDAVGEMSTPQVPAQSRNLTTDAPNIPEQSGATVSAQDAARAAAIARVAASSPSPNGLAKKRRLAAVHARSADALAKDGGADEVSATGWARFAILPPETGGGSCASTSPSPLASETSIAPMLREALRAIKQEHADKQDSAFRALLTYVTNIIEHPDNPQFRRINKVRSSLWNRCIGSPEPYFM